MEKLIDKFLTSLLTMAERITGKCLPPTDEPKAPQTPPVIRFSKEDRVIEGDLFG